MSPSVLPSRDPAAAPSSAFETKRPAAPKPDADITRRFEQMLWAEMLNHAGLEKSLTLGGGEAASAFSRFVIEDIARDLAEKHPLGLGDRANVQASNAYNLATGTKE